MTDNRTMRDFMSMTQSELLDICIGKGCEYDIEEINNSSVSDIASRYDGVGNHAASVMMAAIALGRKTVVSEHVGVIRTPSDVYKAVCNDLTGLDHEEFMVLYLGQKNQIIKKQLIGVGGMTCTIVDVRIIFQVAMQCKAANIAVAHNHPSGTLAPSKSDKELTEQIRKAGSILNIKLVDHVIIGQQYGQVDYYSFTENSLL
ncbi:MAG: JAB domain-containing protein [Bacteroidales bacterium]|nr:JAB domain-containing protein [Candidatus Colimorpha merdihippi]